MLSGYMDTAVSGSMETDVNVAGEQLVSPYFARSYVAPFAGSHCRGWGNEIRAPRLGASSTRWRWCKYGTPSLLLRRR